MILKNKKEFTTLGNKKWMRMDCFNLDDTKIGSRGRSQVLAKVDQTVLKKKKRNNKKKKKKKKRKEKGNNNKIFISILNVYSFLISNTRKVISIS